MTEPLATVDPNFEEKRPPYDHANARPTRKRPVAAPPFHEEHNHPRPAADSVVPNTRDSNVSAFRFDLSCLSFPLQTLTQTSERRSNDYIHAINLAQAYHTIYNRLRASRNSLTTFHQEPEQVSQLKGNIITLVQCLRRDINEGLQFFSHAQSASLGKSTSTETSFTWVLEDPEIQMSVGASFLCQSALQVAAIFMMIPVFYGLISDAERILLLHPIVEICMEHHLPIFDHTKVQCLAFSCLRTDAASAWLGLSHLEGIAETITFALGLADKDDLHLHALKTVQRFICLDPARNTKVFSTTLPKVLALLSSSAGVCRTEAVDTVCAFALAKCKVGNAMAEVFTDLSASVHQFLSIHQSCKSVEADSSLPCILKEAVKGDGAIWVHVSLAALIVISDAHIFFRPRSLRLVLNALRYSSRHKIPTVANLHTEVWKCLVGTLPGIFTVPGGTDMDARKDTYQRAVQLLAQEMRPGIGTRLVCVLMQGHGLTRDESFTTWSVQQAVDITMTLVKHKDPRHVHEGFTLLGRLVCGFPSSEGVDDDTGFLAFVRTALIDGSWTRLSMTELDKALGEFHPITVSHIRQLAESEVQRHWESLSETWATAVERLESPETADTLVCFVLPPRRLLLIRMSYDQEQLTEIWQSLILSQAHLTQGQTHLTTSNPVAQRLAIMILRFMTPTAEPAQRVRHLTLIQKWWNVLKNVFDQAWLSVPAETILNGILGVRIDFTVQQVQEAWVSVCSELIPTGIPTVLHLLRTRATIQNPELMGQAMEELRATRALWLLCGRHYARVDSGIAWVDLLSLLVVPFMYKMWTLSDLEVDMWKQIFATLLIAAGHAGVEENELLQHMVSQAEEGYRDPMILTLFATAAAAPPKYPICRWIVRHMDERLLHWYTTRNIPATVKAMAALGRFWRIEEPRELIASIALAQKGIATWLLDEQDHASDIERAEMVKVVLMPALECLASCYSSSPGLLITLEPLFISVFRKPASLGADAFLRFFHRHYRGGLISDPSCPDNLLAAAKSYADICGEPIRDHSSVATNSSPRTVVSDSQSPISPEKRFLRHEYSHFEEFRDMAGYGFQVGDNRIDTECGSSSGRLPTTPKASTSRLAHTHTPRIASSGGSYEGPQGSDGTPEIPVAQSRPAAKRHRTEGDLVTANESTDMKDPYESPPPLKRAKTMFGPLVSPEAPARLLSTRMNMAGKQHDHPTLGSSPLPPLSDLQFGPGCDDDYDSWEAGITHKDIQALKDELDVQIDVEEGEEEGQFDDADSDLILENSNPGLEFPLRSRRRERSQTAPEPNPQSPLLDQHDPFAQHALRRHHTSGSFEEDNTQLNAVRHAYTAVVESDGVSQMGMEELLQLKRLTSRIGQTVDEQLEQQWEREGKVVGRKK
ncbi:hypothetical protein NMY22_g8759 [Coprinellus aureogranulatus]|nr:hypothetical protein NMY22_g8759 [Coprinellus aureogranulatus]